MPDLKEIEEAKRQIKNLLGYMEKDNPKFYVADIPALSLAISCLEAMVKAEMPKERITNYILPNGSSKLENKVVEKINAENEDYNQALANCRPLIASRDMRIAELEDELKSIKDSYAATINEPCTGTDDRQHCTCVPALRQRITKLQLEKAVLEKFWKENFIAQAKEFDLALAKLQAENTALKKQLAGVRDKGRIEKIIWNTIKTNDYFIGELRKMLVEYPALAIALATDIVGEE